MFLCLWGPHQALRDHLTVLQHTAEYKKIIPLELWSRGYKCNVRRQSYIQLSRAHDYIIITYWRNYLVWNIFPALPNANPPITLLLASAIKMDKTSMLNRRSKTIRRSRFVQSHKMNLDLMTDAEMMGGYTKWCKIVKMAPVWVWEVLRSSLRVHIPDTGRYIWLVAGVKTFNCGPSCFFRGKHSVSLPLLASPWKTSSWIQRTYLSHRGFPAPLGWVIYFPW